MILLNGARSVRTSPLPGVTLNHLKESAFDYLTLALWKHQQTGKKMSGDFVRLRVNHPAAK